MSPQQPPAGGGGSGNPPPQPTHSHGSVSHGSVSHGVFHVTQLPAARGSLEEQPRVLMPGTQVLMGRGWSRVGMGWGRGSWPWSVEGPGGPAGSTQACSCPCHPTLLAPARVNELRIGGHYSEAPPRRLCKDPSPLHFIRSGSHVASPCPPAAWGLVTAMVTAEKGSAQPRTQGSLRGAWVRKLSANQVPPGGSGPASGRNTGPSAHPGAPASGTNHPCPGGSTAGRGGTSQRSGLCCSASRCQVALQGPRPRPRRFGQDVQVHVCRWPLGQPLSVSHQVFLPSLSVPLAPSPASRLTLGFSRRQGPPDRTLWGLFISQPVLVLKSQLPACTWGGVSMWSGHLWAKRWVCSGPRPFGLTPPLLVTPKPLLAHLVRKGGALGTRQASFLTSHVSFR